MLEIRNVTRVYKPKKGISVTALDNISLKFPDKGMVFILGKSGSGKSTLLNVMGGLDKYDSGEIIIKGKSSKDFSQGDFDSYRNTYLGFIFQEYNILNEFSVGANIGLALELQGKKATNEAVNEILNEVDLVGYGSRKPSELSGGQKQRVAIARALVKSPEIIMADEPTGALDSNTGLQVFDTLKKLSYDKLVLVVTHDREFAELYGDRVIELKDGKIISDIEKFKSAGEKKNDSINIIDDKIIQIKKGYALTPSDLIYINKYISEHDAIISIDNKANADMKKFARIDTDGNREAFKNTDETKIIPVEGSSFKLIKSKLPLKNSFKIGASSLKNKPFRLFVTILLSMVAFSMFGLADTMGAYNKYTTTKNSIVDSNINSFTLQKNKVIYNAQYDYTSTYGVNSNDSDIATVEAETGLDFDRVYIPDNYSSLSFSDALNESASGISLYTRSFGGFYEADAADVTSLGFTFTGTLPTAFDEIAISEYAYNHFTEYGYKEGTTTKKASEITSKEIFLGFNPKITINSVQYKVTAIIDTQFDYDHFESLTEQGTNDLVSYLLLSELSDTVNYGYHGLIYVADGFINKQIELAGPALAGIELDNAYFSISNHSNSYGDGYAVSYTDYIGTNAQRLYNMADLNSSGYQKYLSGGRTALAQNEFMLDFYSYYNMIYNAIYATIGSYEYAPTPEQIKQYAPEWYYEYECGLISLSEYINNYITGILTGNSIAFNQMFLDSGSTQAEVDSLSAEQKLFYIATYLEYNPDDSTYCKSYNTLNTEYTAKYGTYTNETYKHAVISAAVASGDIMNSNGLIPSTFYLSANSYLTGYSDYSTALTLVGIMYDPDFASKNESTFVVDDTLYTNLDSGESGNYAYLIAKMPTDNATLTKIIKFSYDYLENNTSYSMKNGVMSTLDMVNELIETLAKVFLYIGIGFAVFASLMLMNYIATSISYKRREIGILRAVGARSSDVFGIFFNESLLIAFINFVLATIATFVAVTIINSYLRTDYNILITLLSFGIRQIGLMLGISVAVAFIASFLPVYKVARQRPIDAIKK